MTSSSGKKKLIKTRKLRKLKPESKKKIRKEFEETELGKMFNRMKMKKEEKLKLENAEEVDTNYREKIN